MNPTMTRLFVIIVALGVFVAINGSIGLRTTNKNNGSNSTNVVSNNKTNCDKGLLDTCVTTLMVFGRRNVYLPQNSQEMIPHCKEEFDAEDCVKNFAKKCLTPFERQVAGMLILGAGQVLRKRCNQDGTKEYLSHYRCIKKAIPQLHDAMDQLVYTLMEVSDTNNIDSKIPTSCCAFGRFQDIANKIVRSNCNEFDLLAEDYIGNKMIKGYVSDVLDLSCQGYDYSSTASSPSNPNSKNTHDNNDKCSKVRIPAGGYEWRNNTLTKIQRVKLPPNKPNSVVLPFLNIFTNL